jgi:tight adherence protein C
MTLDLIVTLTAVFLLIAMGAGWATANMLSATSPERRRLRQLAMAGGYESVADAIVLVDDIGPGIRRFPGVPRSPKKLSQLRRRLAMAGYEQPAAVAVFAAASLLVPLVLVALVITLVGLRSGFILAIFVGAIGYLLPGIALARQMELRKREIRNGLPDALDLLIVCVEAGCGLDQAIVKASEELDIAYPALAQELRLVTTEIRAGKPRLDAFKNFAARTQVDDVRSLVALLIQTDKFGTSIAQALRTHAETSRTKRRQRAEERAAKVGVKLVFPLVLFLFPALYVVILGPAVIQFVRVFMPALR